MEGKRLSFYEFFSGGGMARLGLGSRWRVSMANDICEKKAHSYRMNFNGGNELVVKSVSDLLPSDLPAGATLAWASFPCQDLSLAGPRRGLDALRSGMFWPFWRLMNDLLDEGRPVPLIVLENVIGTVTSNNGKDLGTIVSTLAAAGYWTGALVLDAVHFVPQSRRRLFVVACRTGRPVPVELYGSEPDERWHPRSLLAVHCKLPEDVKARWMWWRLPQPHGRRMALTEVIEGDPAMVSWHSGAETERLLSLMSLANLEKVRKARALGQLVVGTVYRRTRTNQRGHRTQRAEVRFDQICGCLRTPAGGSSRQVILFVEGDRVTSRLLSAREAARLMGVPDSYCLPGNYTDAYHLMGDGLVVPVVEWLEKHILFPLARSMESYYVHPRANEDCRTTEK